jgi:hypothetical protein
MNQVIALAIGCLFAWGSYRAVGHWWKRRQVHAKADHGRDMENQAGEMLEEFGYTAIKQHPTISYTWSIDGQEREATVTPDWLVKRDGKKYLVEVKTGNQANPNQAKIRRQLMEYYIFGSTDGVVYFDADREVARHVSFPIKQGTRAPGWMWIALLISTGTAIFSVWKLLSY